MFMHFPVFVDATYTAIKNHLLGRTHTTFNVTKKDGTRTRIPSRYLLPLLGFSAMDIYAVAGHLNRFFRSEHLVDSLWRLESSAWGLLPIIAITYGLYYFNGLKNTLSDLSFGLSHSFGTVKPSMPLISNSSQQAPSSAGTIS
jgi:hypothetical protein